MTRKRTAAGSVQLVNAAVRVFSILERLSRGRSMGLEEISREVGLAKPTVYRFLQTLQELGYVRRDERDRWALTLKMFMVGSRILDNLDLIAVARPVAEELSKDLGEAVHMGVIEGDSAVYVLKIESRYTIRMFSRVGRRVPLYCSALGKVLLAFASAEEREASLEGVRLVAFTPRTITTRAALDAELSRVKTEGFARDDEEHEEGIRCIGAPVFDHSGSVVAALSASWPAFRYGRGDEAEKVGRVVAAAARISAVMGYGIA
jgi:IclR family KDG regulon transcriptional repressor